MAPVERFLDKYQHRIVGLDIMRSVAILVVLFHHGRLLIPKNDYAIYDQFLLIKIDGVLIFFVLSGFLVGGILIRMIHETNFTRNDLWRFFVRRWFRTIPTYLLVLLIVLVAKWLHSGGVGDFSLTYFMFLQNFTLPHPYFFGEAWSLSIEEWFYLGFPLCCYGIFLITDHKDRAILLSSILWLLIPFLLRIVMFELGMENDFRKVVVYRLDSIMYGVIGAYIYYHYPRAWVKSSKPLLALGVLSVTFLYLRADLWDFYNPLTYNFSCIACLFFLPYLSSLSSTKSQWFDSSVVFISVISYSLYLLNLSPVQGYLIPLVHAGLSWLGIIIENKSIFDTILFWICSFTGAYFLYTYFERPVMSLNPYLRKVK